MKATIISAFPGTGKTYLSYNDPLLTILDSDSSSYSWVKGVRNPDFPGNYIKHIKDNIDKADLILVSSHLEVRKALVKEGIKFMLVYPEMQLKKEYIKRYADRDSEQFFCDLLYRNWEKWITELQNQKGCSHTVMKKGEYLTGILTPSGTPQCLSQ